MSAQVLWVLNFDFGLGLDNKDVSEPFTPVNPLGVHAAFYMHSIQAFYSLAPVFRSGLDLGLRSGHVNKLSVLAF